MNQFRKPGKFLHNASKHTEGRIAAVERDRADESLPGTSLYSTIPKKRRPEWLGDVSAKKFGAWGLNKRHPNRTEAAPNLYHVVMKLPNRKDRWAGLQRIGKMLPCAREKYRQQVPQASCWYNDEDTYELGKAWDDWEDQVRALRAYLKEDILRRQETVGIDGGADNKFDTLENVQTRIEYNVMWNEANESRRESVFEAYNARSEQMAEQAAAHALDVQTTQDIRHAKQLRDFVKANRNEPTSTSDKIDLAVDEPVLYNFSINQDGSIHSRNVPSNENVDLDYVQAQENLSIEMRDKWLKDDVLAAQEAGKLISGDTEQPTEAANDAIPDENNSEPSKETYPDVGKKK